MVEPVIFVVERCWEIDSEDWFIWQILNHGITEAHAQQTTRTISGWYPHSKFRLATYARRQP